MLAMAAMAAMMPTVMRTMLQSVSAAPAASPVMLTMRELRILSEGAAARLALAGSRKLLRKVLVRGLLLRLPASQALYLLFKAALSEGWHSQKLRVHHRLDRVLPLALALLLRVLVVLQTMVATAAARAPWISS